MSHLHMIIIMGWVMYLAYGIRLTRDAARNSGIHNRAPMWLWLLFPIVAPTLYFFYRLQDLYHYLFHSGE